MLRAANDRKCGLRVRRRRCHVPWFAGALLLALVLLALPFSAAVPAAEAPPPYPLPYPPPRPVPPLQVLPLPYDQASFQWNGQELTRYHFSPALLRPFCYPMQRPGGRSLTRMGHPRDPISHSHHNGLWISHHDVDGVNFWTDHGGSGVELGRIEHQRIEQYEDLESSAFLLASNLWKTRDGRPVMCERRRVEVFAPNDGGDWRMTIDLELAAPAAAPVVLGQTPFGMIGVRMAKTIGVHDGGGRSLNSEGQRNEAELFRKPARWVDYSGPIEPGASAGITLMDHPANPGHPTPIHVRDDGWMGACLTLDGPITIEPGKPLRLRYGLWVHEGTPDGPAIEPQWKAFAALPLPPMQPQRP